MNDTDWNRDCNDMIDPLWSVALYEKWLEVGAVKSHASSTQVERKKANIHAWLRSTLSKLNMFLNEVLSGQSSACGSEHSLTISEGLTFIPKHPKNTSDAGNNSNSIWAIKWILALSSFWDSDNLPFRLLYESMLAR